MTQTDINNLDFVLTLEDAGVTVYDTDGSLTCDLGDPSTTDCTMEFTIDAMTKNGTFTNVQSLVITFKSECYHLLEDYTYVGTERQ